MLCPALKDPFEGQNYRIAAIIHQGIFCPFLAKLFTVLFTPSTKNLDNFNEKLEKKQKEEEQDELHKKSELKKIENSNQNLMSNEKESKMEQFLKKPQNAVEIMKKCRIDAFNYVIITNSIIPKR